MAVAALTGRARALGVVLALLVASPVAAQLEDVELHGFLEFGAGGRVVEDALQPDDILLGEARFQLDLAHYGDPAEMSFKGDFVSDGVTGEVDVDIRQAVISVRAADWLDVRAGRQVLTWGTGDLVFLNDLFPKDFVSFFVGRDDEYLKAPANALRLTFYSFLANLDVVATPVFEPDRSITGERISYFDPGRGELVSASTSTSNPAARPARELRNGELALRAFRNVSGYELALYAYRGFTKQPTASDGAGTPLHSRLAVYGASARGALAGGIASVETAYYDGTDDVGDAPTVPNSQLRAVVGYTRELVPDLTGGLQYYAERTLDHDRLVAASAAPELEPSELRHVVTARLTYRLLQQTLTASLFTFASPNDGDAHLRPSLSYDWSDALSVSVGADVMLGDQRTFFGQLSRASNVYARARYAF